VAEGVASGDLLDDLDLKGEGLAVKGPDERGVGGDFEGFEVWKEKKVQLELDGSLWRNRKKNKRF
jgi:hypothetical protein